MKLMKLTERTNNLLGKMIFIERHEQTNRKFLDLILKNQEYDIIQSIMLNQLRKKNITRLKEWYDLEKEVTEYNNPKEPQPNCIDLKVEIGDMTETYKYFTDKINSACGVPKVYVDGKVAPYIITSNLMP